MRFTAITVILIARPGGTQIQGWCLSMNSPCPEISMTLKAAEVNLPGTRPRLLLGADEAQAVTCRSADRELHQIGQLRYMDSREELH